MSGLFDAYAAYYNLLYRDKDYTGEAEYVHRLVHEFSGERRSILELGCGTGIHAAELARRGHTVCGIDRSQEMLDRAQELRTHLPPEVASRLQFMHGDIRDWRGQEPHDVVVSLFHVLSYQVANQDVAAALATASRHLKPGGIFIFDFWYGPAVLVQRPETRVRQMTDEAIHLLRVAQSRLDTSTDTVEVEYQLLVEQRETGKLSRLQETHRMRYFFLPEIDHHLSVQGMERVHSEEWMTRRPLSAETWGAMVVACRRK